MSAAPQIDWFGTNAPGGKQAPKAAGKADWFAQNAPPPVQQEAPVAVNPQDVGFVPAIRSSADTLLHGVLSGLQQSSPQPSGTLRSGIEAALTEAIPGIGPALTAARELPSSGRALLGSKQPSEDVARMGLSVTGLPIAEIEKQARAGSVPGMIGAVLPPLGALAAGTILGGGPNDRSFLGQLRKGVSTRSLEERAAQPLEAGAEHVRKAVGTATDNARKATEPLYDQLQKTDEQDIANRKAAGSIDIGAAKNTLDAAERQLFGSTGAPKAVLSEQERLGTFTVPGTQEKLATLQEARILRGKLYQAEQAARAKGDYRSASALGASRTSLTEQMRSRSDELGLGNDFERADRAYHEARQDEEVLANYGQGGAKDIFGKKSQLTPEARAALQRLQKGGYINQGQFEQTLKTGRRLLGAGQGWMPNFGTRFAAGVIPAAAGLYELERHGVKLPGVLHSPFLAGYAGLAAASLLAPRIAALGELANLPKEFTPLPRLGPGDLTPSTPRPLVVPPAASTAARVPTTTVRREALPLSPEEQARLQVPLELQPRPGEQPIQNMLESILGEKPSVTPEQNARAYTLTAQLQKAAERARARARTAEQMQAFKKRNP